MKVAGFFSSKILTRTGVPWPSGPGLSPATAWKCSSTVVAPGWGSLAGSAGAGASLAQAASTSMATNVSNR